MLQKINLILLIIVMLFVVAMCILLWNAQRNADVAIDALSTQVQDLRAELEQRDSPGGETRRAASPGVAGGQVSITGAVQRPGIYALPGAGGLTIPGAISAAGGLTTVEEDVLITLVHANGERTERPLSGFAAEAEPTFLKPGDTLYVHMPTDGSPQSDSGGTEMPRVFMQHEVDQLSASEIQKAILQLVNARNRRSQYSAAQLVEIDRQYMMLMDRLRRNRAEDQ